MNNESEQYQYQYQSHAINHNRFIDIKNLIICSTKGSLLRIELFYYQKKKLKHHNQRKIIASRITNIIG